MIIKDAFFYLWVKNMSENITVGGQAVIEGVMMRVPDHYATAVRRKNGEIETQREPQDSLTERFPIFKKKILRGAISLLESFKIGYSTLQWSADKAIEDEEEVEEESTFWKFLSTALAFILAIGLFLVLPLYLTTTVLNISKQAFAFNIIAGSLRIIFFLVYLWSISLMEDVKRLFEYHGAEHKVVFTFEAGEEVNVENARKYSTQHPRCGTSFIFIVLLISILLYSLIDSIIIYSFGTISLITRIFYHLGSVPLVAGICYELLKLSSRHSDNPITKILIQPGLWLQRITTSSPSDEQLETAIVALKTAFGDEFEKYHGKEYKADAID